MSQPPPLPSDGQLLDGARSGMSGAWEELVRRHAAAITGVARAELRFGSRKAVERALDELHAEIGASNAAPIGTPTSTTAGDTAGGARAVRPRLLARLTGGAYGPGPDVDASVASITLAGTSAARIDLDDLASVARAFATLPEPWQTALWHRVVEQQPAAEYAPLLGRAANDAASAVQRADAGLFEAYLLDQRAHRAVAPACAAIIPLLGGSLRSTLSAHEQRLVDVHLGGAAAPAAASTAAAVPSVPAPPVPNSSAEASSDDGAVGCAACSRRIAVSRELSALLPAAVVPGLTKMTVERYRAAAGVRRASASVDPDERRRRIAFAAIFCGLLLAAGAAVLLTRDSLKGSDDQAAVTTATTATGESSVPGPTSTESSTGPTTTELQLRPTASGPVNAIDIVFEDGPAGFAAVDADLTVVFSNPGPIFAGGTGTIDATVTNAGAADARAVATLVVPDGIVFDTMVDGPAVCEDPADGSARCEISVAAGATERVTLRFSLEPKNVGQLVVSSNLAAEELRAPITATNRLVHSSVDQGQVIVAGNTVMTCVESEPDCLNARNGIGDVVNRWDLPATFIGADLGPDWTNSSAATVDLGAGTVDAAYLFWSGDLKERGVQIPDDGSNRRVSMLPPGAEQPIVIEAERVRLGDVDATQYFGSVDVTDIVRQYGAGDYVVGNVQSVEIQGSYAGWALVVVTRDDTMPRRSNMVITPFSWFSPDDTFAIEVDVPFGGERLAQLDVIAFEGERGFVPEYLTVGATTIGDSSFDSSIIGPRRPSYDNNFGIDIDAYDLVIDASTGILPITASSENDGIRLAVLALAVDVE